MEMPAVSHQVGFHFIARIDPAVRNDESPPVERAKIHNRIFPQEKYVGPHSGRDHAHPAGVDVVAIDPRCSFSAASLLPKARASSPIS